MSWRSEGNSLALRERGEGRGEGPNWARPPDCFSNKTCRTPRLRGVPRAPRLALCVLAASPAPVVPPPPLTLTVAEDGTFSVAREGAGLTDLTASITVSGVEVPLGAATASHAAGDDALGHYAETRLERTQDATRLLLTLHAYPGFVTARLSASCVGTCAGARVEGFTLAGHALTQVSEPTAVFAHGYSSWAPSYYASVQRSTAPSAGVETLGNNDNHLTTDARPSWWLSALVMRTDATVVSGALTADAWKTKVLTWRDDGVQVRLRSGGGGDSLPLGVTGVDSELFFFTVREALNPALAAWANAVATLAPPPEAPFVPVGWNSWNTLFEGVTPDHVLANVARAQELGFALNDAQVDDGWELAWGDWNANAKFPAGMDGLATQLAARQLHAGVWLTPLLANDADTILVRGLPAGVQRLQVTMNLLAGRLLGREVRFADGAWRVTVPGRDAAYLRLR